MMSDNIIGTIAGEIAIKQRDATVNRLGDSFEKALGTERISKARIDRILAKFLEELKKIRIIGKWNMWLIFLYIT